MTAIILGDVVPALDNPEPTATKLGRRYADAADQVLAAPPPAEDEVEEVFEDAPLDRQRFADGIANARAPKWHTGTFGAPLGMRGPMFGALCRQQVGRWIEEQRRRGFDIWSGTRIQIDPGPYPRTDLATGLKLLGEREMLVRAQFVERQPETIRLELPGGLFEAWRPTPLPTSSGDE